jgi:glyoxylase-like metal-dependent hydrolase (beta-lactamase superfamily II)
MEIIPLDLNFQGEAQAIAAYLVVGPQAPVLVETGPASTLDMLKLRLEQVGYSWRDIRHVLVTHIHLDHAGAAGWWAQQGAQVYVHEVGAPHLVDPSRLLSSARRIYGEDMDRLWGDTLPAPADRVYALSDGEAVKAGGLVFTALDTPGHASHHHVICLDRVAFTGDAAGVRLPDSRFISLPAPPPEFDLMRWQKTLERLAEAQFETLYPTHFGPLSDVRQHLERLSALMSRSADFVRVRWAAGLERSALIETYQDWVRQRAFSEGVTQAQFQVYEMANPSFMSVDGLTRYWRKQAQNGAKG